MGQAGGNVMIVFLNWCIGRRRCPCCDRYHWGVKRRRQNTAYVDDQLNWFTSCPRCFEDNEDYWADMWADHYNNVMPYTY